MSMTLAENLAADRRRVILDLLHTDPGYTLSDELLRMSLKHMGRGTHRVDVVRADLAWLAEQGLVRLVKTPRVDGGEDWNGILTRDGQPVAEGAPHPGIARRSPA